MKDFIKVGFDVKGPLFDPGLVKEVQEVINSGIVELATIEGSNKVKDQLYPGHGRITANLRNHVGAALVKDNVVRVDAGETLLGKDIVYAGWVEGVSKRNARSKFKGYKMFENASKHMRTTPGLWDKYIGEVIARIIR